MYFNSILGSGVEFIVAIDEAGVRVPEDAIFIRAFGLFAFIISMGQSTWFWAF